MPDGIFLIHEVYIELKDCYKTAARCAVKQFNLIKAVKLCSLAKKVKELDI